MSPSLHKWSNTITALGLASKSVIIDEKLTENDPIIDLAPRRGPGTPEPTPWAPWAGSRPDHLLCKVKDGPAHSQWLPMEAKLFALIRNNPLRNKGCPCPLWSGVCVKLKVGH